MKHLLQRFFPTLLLLLLLALPASQCYGQWKKADTTQIEIDTTTAADEYEEYETVEEKDDDNEDTATVETAITLYSRTIPADTIATYKASASFAYMGRLDSLLRAADKARRNQPQPPPPVEGGPSLWDSGIVKLICYLAAIGLVGFVIYKLFVGRGLFAFNRKTNTLPAVELEEPDNETDLEKALRSAIARKDYRLGVRYLFLMTLQRLGEKGVLQLSSDKTNYQYATDLAGRPYANNFARLSLQYEYVWFGDFQINEAQFSTIQQQHQQFSKEI